jgi:LPXTG-motif cell wall-anchored protein
MTFNIIHAWVLEVPAVYVLTRLLGYDQTAVWWAISGAAVVSAGAYYLYFRRGRWIYAEV